ncbi:uncharacterized protein LOC110447420 isoform X2 [Mizuhopecten yessoensis]|uniref:uncharacterized protein LOC110447420 isoform X1 n=1 Tax=Mizuhopecten yessoensis TaxID=6573 RepID=UPI000B45F4C8|nr:uncharacterized protein LOC110447420 isoform X1 [Mizuhopecten yessoensis]XP_021348775.1 uncharacterized protein LOC110447420 isoform X2 [Mizuhopecten yessoensis]
MDTQLLTSDYWYNDEAAKGHLGQCFTAVSHEKGGPTYWKNRVMNQVVQPYSNTFIPDIHYYRMACSKHPGKPIEMVCSSCHNKLVCHECIEKSHIGHKFVELKTAAERIVAGLQQQKRGNSYFSEIQRDLKDCQTVTNRERELEKQSRDETVRRRDLLERIVKEMAEKLLQDQEKYFKKIFSTLEEHKKDNEEKVQQVLKFQCKLAELEKSTDYINVIQTGKSIVLPRYTKHQIPSLKRMTMKPGCAIDRDQVQKAFGPIDIDDMINSYIVLPVQVPSVYSVADSLDSNDLFGDGNMTSLTREQSLDLTALDNDVDRRRQVSPDLLSNQLRTVCNVRDTTVQQPSSAAILDSPQYNQETTYV